MNAPYSTSSWKTVPFSEMVDILDTQRIPVNSKERAERLGDVPYYGATGQVGVIDKHIFDEELVLLGEDGAPFLDPAKPKAYLISGKSWVNNHAHVLRAKQGLLNAFLLYQLNCVDYRPYVSGTTRLKLPQGPMKRIPLLVPSLPEQHRIVSEIEKQFTRLDAGVAALKRVQANLKRYRAAVLKAACEGKLVPTEAELARAEDRTYEPADQLLARILTERRKKCNGKGKYKEPAEPDTTNLPELPEGWTWANVGQFADVNLGKMLDKNKHRTGRKFSYLRNINVRWGSVDTDDLLEMFFKDEELERYGLKAGDVLVCEGGEPGRSAIWDGRISGMMYQKAIHRVRFFDSSCPNYLVFVLEMLAKSGRLERSFTGSTIKHFTRESFVSLPIPLPLHAEQLRIVAEVERRLSVVEELKAVVDTNLQRATRLQQAILQKAFSENK